MLSAHVGSIGSGTTIYMLLQVVWMRQPPTPLISTIPQPPMSAASSKDEVLAVPVLRWLMR